MGCLSNWSDELGRSDLELLAACSPTAQRAYLIAGTAFSHGCGEFGDESLELKVVLTVEIGDSSDEVREKLDIR